MEYKHYIIEEARAVLEARNDRSAWNKAVTEDAIDLLNTVAEVAEEVNKKYTATAEGGELHVMNLLRDRNELTAAMLNGAETWSQYSWSGCALVYDGDIAEHYCTPSELKKTRHGERRPNGQEEWLDVQARALSQAAQRVRLAIKDALRATRTVKGVYE